MGLIVAVFLLGMSFFTPLWSNLGERTGNKFAFQLSVVLFIVGSALEGISPNILFFVCARLLTGIQLIMAVALVLLLPSFILNRKMARAN